MFFVISGYLITTNIIRDVERDRFSLLEFYRKRVMRIVPAMLLVVCFTLAAAYVLMLPEDARQVSKSAVFSLASMANVFFWVYEDAGYFAQSSLEMPLLHLWSLGVEEQFYLLWPMIIVTLHTRARGVRTAVALVAVALVSFWMGSAFFVAHPSFVYYMLPTRAGELLIGAIAALVVLNRWDALVAPRVAQLVAPAGAFLLLASLLMLSEETPFPGWSALVPTIGTALLILGGHRSPGRVTRLFASRPLVAVGLISYSAYLWHWPLMAFFRYGYGEIGLGSGVVLFLATLCAAWVAYTFVEQPARHATGSVRRIVATQFVIPTAILGGVALVLVYPTLVGRSALQSAAYLEKLSTIRNAAQPAFLAESVCQFQTIEEADFAAARCVGGEQNGAVDALLWGDSNAAHYVQMLDEVGKFQGFSLRNMQFGACPPLLSDPTAFVAPSRASACRAASIAMRSETKQYPVVILSALWNGYAQRSSDFFPEVASTVERLAAEHQLVVLIGKAPTLTGFDRRCREKQLSFPLLECEDIVVQISEDVKTANQRLQEIATRTKNVLYFDANDVLCPEGECRLNGGDGQPKYYDARHLSVSGSRALGKAVTSSAATSFPLGRSTIAGRHQAPADSVAGLPDAEDNDIVGGKPPRTSPAIRRQVGSQLE